MSGKEISRHFIQMLPTSAGQPEEPCVVIAGCKPKAKRSTSRNCSGWSPTAARPTSAT